jgi:hypothetical protein
MNEKVLWTINVALVFVAVFLILNLLDMGLPTLGKAQYWLDDSEPICIASFGAQKSLIGMDSCCYGLQMQLACENWKEPVMVNGEEMDVSKRCYTGKGAIDYFVNMKAFNYCEFN